MGPLTGTKGQTWGSRARARARACTIMYAPLNLFWGQRPPTWRPLPAAVQPGLLPFFFIYFVIRTREKKIRRKRPLPPKGGNFLSHTNYISCIFGTEQHVTVDFDEQNVKYFFIYTFVAFISKPYEIIPIITRIQHLCSSWIDQSPIQGEIIIKIPSLTI